MSIYSTISPLFKHFKLPRPHSHLILTRSYTHTIPYLASQNLQSPPLFFFTVFSLKTLPLPFPVSILPFRHFLPFLFRPFHFPFLPFPVSSLPQLHPFHLNTMKFNLFVFHIFLFPPVYHTFKSFILFSVSFLLTRSSFLHFPVSSIPTRPSFFPFLFTPFLPDLLSPLSCFLRFL